MVHTSFQWNVALKLCERLLTNIKIIDKTNKNIQNKFVIYNIVHVI